MLTNGNGYVEVLSRDHATKEEALGYLDAAISLVRSVDGWEIDAELQMFLDQRSTPVTMLAAPEAFVVFYEDWQGNLHGASVDAGFVEHMSFRNIRALARAIATSFTRRKFYLTYLKGRRAGILEGKDYKLPTFHELELRYQYHLYVLDHESVGVAIDKDFKEWCNSDECHTFLDVIELTPDKS